jgi:hypothetical protein
MESDWSVACAADDPTLALPWNTSDGTLYFIDLRKNPSAIAQIPEAAKYPAIASALGRWNQPDSPIFTAKADVWAYPARLFDADDLPGFAFAQGSYIDLVPRDGTIFANFTLCENILRRASLHAQEIESATARCEWTLRRAHVDSSLLGSDLPTATQNEAVEGFSISLYVWGYGDSAPQADVAWAAALVALIEIVRRFVS